MCPHCRQPLAACACRRAASAPGDGRVRVSLQTKGRAGKGVTLIQGLALDGEALQSLCRQLKTLLGVGGAVKDGVVELQGDHRERVLLWLQQKGHAAKRAGG